MKKTLIASLLSFASIAQAHDLWVDVPAQISSDSILKANIGYGHYPYVEKVWICDLNHKSAVIFSALLCVR